MGRRRSSGPSPHLAKVSRVVDTLRDIVRVTPDRWDELVELFGPSGAYSNCWCTFFRQRGSEYDAGCRRGGVGNRALLARIIAEGRVPGLMAVDATTRAPLGWVSVAPRPEFGRVMRSPLLDPAAREDEGVWSVVCFWVPRAHRGRGVARSLLDGAVRYALEQGAASIEGYPVDTEGERRPASNIYTGTLELFARAGFEVAYCRRPNRPVVHRTA